MNLMNPLNIDYIIFISTKVGICTLLKGISKLIIKWTSENKCDEDDDGGLLGELDEC